MQEKSRMENIYDNYLKSDDKIILIGNSEYYRIIHKERILNKIIIVVPYELFRNKKVGSVIDENGKIFKPESPVHYSFRGAVPTWYLNTLSFIIGDIKDVDDIVNYLRIL